MNKLRFPASVRANFTEAEQAILLSFHKLHQCDQDLSRRLPPDQTPSPLDPRCKYDMRGTTITMSAMYATTAAAFGMTLQDAYELHNRQSKLIVAALWDTFFEDEQDRLMFELKSPTKTEFKVGDGFGAYFAEIKSSGIDDKPCSIKCLNWGLYMRWGTDRRPHRDIDLGPAHVSVGLTVSNDGVSIQHYVNGDRAAGHKDWRKRCRQHNPWMRYEVEV